MTTHDHHEADDLHAELDRLDRELEQLRARLADEQGALRDARARCRALRNVASEPDPEPNAAGPVLGAREEGSDPGSSAPVRRVPRTSRLASSRLGSRPERVVLRAIAGGALPRPRVTDLSAARAAAARAAAAAARAVADDDSDRTPPDAA